MASVSGKARNWIWIAYSNSILIKSLCLLNKSICLLTLNVIYTHFHDLGEWKLPNMAEENEEDKNWIEVGKMKGVEGKRTMVW